MDMLQIVVSSIGIASILAGLYILLKIPNNILTQKKIEAEGIETTGRIISGERIGKVYVTRYEFMVDGNKVEGTRNLNLKARLPHGNVPLRYLRDKPQKHYIPGIDITGKLSGEIFTAVWGILFIGLGISFIDIAIY